MAKLVTLRDANGEVIYPQTISDMDYSTSEQDTGCKWIDGKKIYKKTLNIPAGPGAGKTIYITGLTLIDNVVNFEGFLSTSALTIYVGAARASTDSALGCWFERDYGRFAIESGASDRSGFNGYVTLYYTKTTG